MKSLTLCTQEYRQALEEFINEGTLPSLSSLASSTDLSDLSALSVLTNSSNLSTSPLLPLLPNTIPPFEVHCTNLDIEALAQFLEHIAVLRHPVYRYSPKLINIALELRHTEIHETNVKQLTQYLQENDTLHLEGYIAFRMADYHNKLDMMTYCIIKRLQIHSPPQ